jgi:exosortase K
MMTATASKKIKLLVWQNGIFYILALFIALGLKYHYSRAGSADLVWVLGPTACLVEHISGIQFESEANTGFVSRGYRIIIAPSCAGINFLIIVFCMAMFSGIHVIRRSGSKLLWLATSLVCAYILTVAVNTLRIIASIHSYNADIHFGWLTPARVHRLEGIVIYFFFLCLFYMIIIKLVHRIRQGAGGKNITAARYCDGQTDYFRCACTCLIPLIWYGLITLGVPLFTGSFQENVSRFKEHSWTVICASLTILAIIFLIQLVRRRIARIIENRLDCEFYIATETPKHKHRFNGSRFI